MAAPIKKFKAGSVSCALWQNELTTKDGPVLVIKATLDRRYRDANGTWKSSNSLSRAEIPLAILALVRAYAAIVDRDGAVEGDDVHPE
jgi:hypothetical protein